MKCHELIRELVDAGCYLKRHGKKHDTYVNSQNGRKPPFHAMRRSSLAAVIRQQLGLQA